MRAWLGMMIFVVSLTDADAAGLDGTYALQAHSGVLITRVEVRGEVLRGVIRVPDGAAVQLTGTARNNQAQGIARSPHGNGQFKAVLVGNALEIVISQPAGNGKQAVDLPLRFIRTP